METSILIAKIIGPAYGIIGIAILLNLDFYKKIMEDFGKNHALYFISSMLSLVFGLLIVINHNTWISNWTVIITLFGWAAILKGIGLLIFPKFNLKFMEKFKTSDLLMRFGGVFATILGVYLSFMACSI